MNAACRAFGVCPPNCRDVELAVRNEGAEDVVEQVGCWMTDGDGVGLENLAKEIGLRRPSACALLIYRELRERRLASLSRSGHAAVTIKGRKRVTARLEDPAIKKAFSDHVRDTGLGSDESTFLLFQAEMSENWLRATLAWNRNHG